MKKLALLSLSLFVSISIVQAAIPQLINYQGLLLEENGSKVTGIKAITLKVFTGATDGNGTKEIYQENVGNVSVTDGLYSFNFGGSGQSVISTNEIVGDGDGSTQIFNYTVDNPPVLDGTAVITKYDSNGSVIATWSQSDGSSVASFISSVVNSTGAVSVTNSAGAPASGEYIQINYDYNSVGIMGALSSNPTAWLEVSVDGSPLLPRQRLVAVPFANVAGTIQGENLAVDPVTGIVEVKKGIKVGEGSILKSSLGNSMRFPHGINGESVSWRYDGTNEYTVPSDKILVITNSYGTLKISYPGISDTPTWSPYIWELNPIILGPNTKIKYNDINYGFSGILSPKGETEPLFGNSTEFTVPDGKQLFIINSHSSARIDVKEAGSSQYQYNGPATYGRCMKLKSGTIVKTNNSSYYWNGYLTNN